MPQPKENLSFAWQVHRLRFRLFVIAQAFVAAVFWLFMASLWSLLHQTGLAWVAWLLLGSWIVIALPALVLQLQALADLVSYAITGRLHFFPLNNARAKNADPSSSNLSPNTLRRMVIVIWSFGLLSPISAFATWTFLVIMRLPKHAQVAAEPIPTFAFEVRRVYRTERSLDTIVMEDILQRFSPRRMTAAF